MTHGVDATVVTAGDAAFAWGTFLLAASMRMNGMRQKLIVGAMDWPDVMKKRVLSLGGVEIVDLPKDKRCVTCQTPTMMNLDSIDTPWVCWADSDGMMVGDISEWLSAPDEDQIAIRKYSPPPPDFTPENLEIWRRDVEKHVGKALDASRYDTRMNAPFIIVNRKYRPFLERWQNQIDKVLPSDVEIIMKHGSAYYQTDESVLGSLLCFDPDAPKVVDDYKANGSADPNRYFAHFAYNPKPWQMWNKYSLKWHDGIAKVVDWAVAADYVKECELPLPLRRRWWPICRFFAFAAPFVWRAIKLKRRLLRR